MSSTEGNAAGIVSENLAQVSPADAPSGPHGSAARAPQDPTAASTRAPSRFRSRLCSIGARGLYWLPVFAPMVLFGEIALLGLRPALCERARLDEAEVALQDRYQKDALQHEVIRANLRARQDPIFLERQRRWLRLAAPAR